MEPASFSSQYDNWTEYLTDNPCAEISLPGEFAWPIMLTESQKLENIRNMTL